MYREAAYDDVIGEIAAELRTAIARAIAAGVRARGDHPRSRVSGSPSAPSTRTQRWPSSSGCAALDRPILSGPSRKSFLNAGASATAPPAERDWGTAAAVTASVLLGAHIVRVHGVREMADVVRVADRIRLPRSTQAAR